jgi:hypothetical protein
MSQPDREACEIIVPQFSIASAFSHSLGGQRTFEAGEGRTWLGCSRAVDLFEHQLTEQPLGGPRRRISKPAPFQNTDGLC